MSAYDWVECPYCEDGETVRHDQEVMLQTDGILFVRIEMFCNYCGRNWELNADITPTHK